jgi:hypothetical protein
MVILARIGRKASTASRRVSLVVPSFQMVPELLQGSDMIALLPSRVLAEFDGLVSFPHRCPCPVSYCISPGIDGVLRMSLSSVLLRSLFDCCDEDDTDNRGWDLLNRQRQVIDKLHRRLAPLWAVLAPSRTRHLSANLERLSASH